jgi:hypothetical protein
MRFWSEVIHTNCELQFFSWFYIAEIRFIHKYAVDSSDVQQTIKLYLICVSLNYVLHVFAKERYCDVSSGLFHQVIVFTLTKVYRYLVLETMSFLLA